MMAVLLAAALAATPPECPGWLGFGFDYRTTMRGGRFAGGWMHVQGVAPGSPAAKAGLANRGECHPEPQRR
jgi:S1-C subfamily serine protease